MIRRTDRVASVLARDERLLEVFAAASPAFGRLRNPALRRTMARLVTVEQAARIAGVDADALVARLNHPLPATHSPAPEPSMHAPEPSPGTPSPAPGWLAELPAEQIVELDVREDLRHGREPFSRIMAAKRELPAGAVLRLRAPFEPVPLYQVMAKQGFDHWTEQLATDDWRVWFFAAAGDPSHDRAAGDEASQPSPAGSEEEVVVLDVRGLEPPEPMVRTLAALAELPPGKTLVQLNVRVPQFLLPRLEESGFSYEIREQGEDLVRTFIRHKQP